MSGGATDERRWPVVCLAWMVLSSMGCAASWQELPDELAPSPEETVSGGLVRVISPRGLASLAVAPWESLAVLYADGLSAPVVQRVQPDDGTGMMLYGPGRLDAWPSGLSYAVTDGATEGVLAVDEVVGTLTLHATLFTGEQVSCAVTVTLRDGSYRFPLVADLNADPPAIRVGGSGSWAEADYSVLGASCPFVVTEERARQAANAVRRDLATRLDEERAERLGPAAADALAPRWAVRGLLRLSGLAGDEEAPRLVVASDAEALLSPAPVGLAHHYAVAVAGGPAGDCAVAPPADEASGAPTPLPQRTLAPDGAAYDEAIVVSGTLLRQALGALGALGWWERPGDVDLSASADTALAIDALWPAETPFELARSREEGFTVRFRLAPGPDGRWPALSLDPDVATGANGFAPLRVHTGLLRIEVYGSVGGADVRLFSLDATRATLDLVPTVGEPGDGALRLRVAAFQTEGLDARRGLLSLPRPDAAWVRQLLDAWLSGQTALDLGALGSPAPELAGGEWLEERAYVLYLRRPAAALRAFSLTEGPAGGQAGCAPRPLGTGAALPALVVLLVLLVGIGTQRQNCRS